MAVPKKKRSRKYYYNKLFLKSGKALLHKPVTNKNLYDHANIVLELSNDLVSVPVVIL